MVLTYALVSIIGPSQGWDRIDWSSMPVNKYLFNHLYMYLCVNGWWYIVVKMNSFVHFLGEFEEPKKSFRNCLTFMKKSDRRELGHRMIDFPVLASIGTTTDQHNTEGQQFWSNVIWIIDIKYGMIFRARAQTEKISSALAFLLLHNYWGWFPPKNNGSRLIFYVLYTCCCTMEWNHFWR